MSSIKRKDLRLNTPLLFCFQCSTIPIISIIPNHVITLQKICQCSKTIINLSDYVFQLNKISKEIKHHTIYCDNVLSHSNKKAKGYCILCKNYLCMIALSSIIPINQNIIQLHLIL